MGRKAFRKILALLVMVFGAVTVFGACNKDPYKKMKLEVSETAVNVTYDEEGDNTFSLSATVSGVGKNVSTDVEWVIEDKSVVLPSGENYIVKDGSKTTATFYATTTGGPTYITVRTIEGGLSEKIKVNVDIPIKNLEFDLSTLPIERNVKTDITTKFEGGTTEVYNRIKYTPEYTTERNVKLEVVGMNGEDISNEVSIDGNFITVTSETLTSFKLKATSIYDTNLNTTVDVEVLDTITADNVLMKERNSSGDESVAMATIVENGIKHYALDLANMGEDESRKVLFADYSGDGSSFNEKYTLTYSVKSENQLPFRISKGEENQYILDTGFGTNTGYVNFLLNYKGYEKYFTPKTLPVKVNVSTFPSDIYFSEPGKTEKITNLRVFKNYNSDKGYFGAKFVLNIKNGDIVVGSQTARISIVDTNTGNEIVNGISLFTMSSNNVRTEISHETHVKHGTTLYMTYDYNQLKELLNNPNTNIVVRATAVVKNTIVSDNLGIKFVKEDVYPSLQGFESPVVELAKGEEVIFDSTVLSNNGLNNLGEYTMVLTRGLNDIVSVIYDNNADTWTIASDPAKPLLYESTTLTMTTPNGFSLSVTIRVLEQYTKENLFFRIGDTDYSVYDDDTEANANCTTLYLSTNSMLEIKMGYIQDGEKYLFDNIPQNLIFADVEYSSTIIGVDLSYLNISTRNATGESDLKYIINSKFFDTEENLYICFKVEVDVRITGFGITNEMGQSISSFSLISTESIYHEDAEKYKVGKFIITSYPNIAELDIDNIAWKLSVKNDDLYTIDSYTEENREGGDGEYSVYKYVLDTDKFEITIVITAIEDNKLYAEVYTKWKNYSATSRIEYTLTFAYTQTYLDIKGNSTTLRHDSSSLNIMVSKAIKTTKVSLDRTEILFNLNQLRLDNDGKVQDMTRNKVSGVYTISPSSTNILVKGLEIYYSIDSINPEGYTYGEMIRLDLVDDYCLIADGRIKLYLDENNLSFRIEVLRYTEDCKYISLHFVPKDSKDSAKQYNPEYPAWGHLMISFRDGNSEETAYKISDAYDLQFINNDLDAYYVVTNNIYIPEDTIWTPIGANYSNAFKGNINGKNYTINGLKIIRTATTGATGEGAYNATHNTANRYSIYYGLFGYVGKDAIIKDFSLQNITFRITYSGESETDKIIDVYMGAVAGYSEGQITNIRVIDDPNFGYSSFNGKSLNLINATRIAENIDEDIETGKKSLAYTADALAKNQSNNLYFGGVVGLNAGYVKSINANVTLFVRDQQINPTDNGITTAYVGGIAGVNYAKNYGDNLHPYGKIENSKVISLINSSLNDANFKSAIFNPESVVGGVVGVNSSGAYMPEITQISSTAEILNIDVRTVIIALNNVGGVAGQNFGLIDTAVVKPNIIANKNVGGITGTNARLGSNQYSEHGEGLSRRFVANKTTHDIDVVDLDTAFIHFVNGVVYQSKVQFVDRMDEVSFMNTGIIASENVGGVVGYNYDIFNVSSPHKTEFDLSLIDSISNKSDYASIVYSSAHSYFTIDPSSPTESRRQVASSADELLYFTSLRLSREAILKAHRYEDKENPVSIFNGSSFNEDGLYYGDIVILPNISSLNSENTKVYAGGLVGFADGKVSTYPSIKAGIAIVHAYSNINVINHSATDIDLGYTLEQQNYYTHCDIVYGGLIGKAKGVLFVYNTNVLGKIDNAKVENIGGFVGDASEIYDRLKEEYNCDPYVTNSDGFFVPNNTTDKFGGIYNINNSYTLLKNANNYIQNFAAKGLYKKVAAASGVGYTTNTMKVEFSNVVSNPITETDGVTYTTVDQITAGILTYKDTKTGETQEKTLSIKKQVYRIKTGEREVEVEGVIVKEDIYSDLTRFVFDYEAGKDVFGHISISGEVGNQEFTLRGIDKSAENDGDVIGTFTYDTTNIFHMMLYYMAEGGNSTLPQNVANLAYTNTSMNLLTTSNSYYIGFETTMYGNGIAFELDFQEEYVNSIEIGKVEGTEYTYSYYPHSGQEWHYTNLVYDDLTFDEYHSGSGDYHLYLNTIADSEILPEYKNGDVIIVGGGNINPDIITTGSYSASNYLNRLYIVETGYENSGLNTIIPNGEYLYYNSTVNNGVPIAFGQYQNSPKQVQLIIDIQPQDITIEHVGNNKNYNMESVEVDMDDKVVISSSTSIQPLGIIVEKGETYLLINPVETDINKFIIDIKSLPEFVGYSSIVISSSDEKVAKIIQNGDIYELQAISTGDCVLTITSQLNNSLKREVVVVVRDNVTALEYSYKTNNATYTIENNGLAQVLKGSNATFAIELVKTIESGENTINQAYVSENIGVEYIISGVDNVTIDGVVYTKSDGNISATVLGYSHIFKVNNDFEVEAKPFYIYTIKHNGNEYSYRQYLENVVSNSNIKYSVVQTSFAYNIYAPNNMENSVSETATFDILVKSNDSLLVPVYVTFAAKNEDGSITTTKYAISKDDNTTSGLAFYKIDENGVISENESDSITINSVTYEIIGFEYDAISRQHTITIASFVIPENYENITSDKKFEITVAITDTYDGVKRDDKFSYTVLPFAIEDVKLSHYTKFFYDKSLAEGTTDPSVKEEDYRSYKYVSNKIVPGNSSLFEIRITPFYAQLDYLTVEIVGDSSNKSIIQQLLEGLQSRDSISGISNYYQYPYFTILNGRNNYIKIDNKYSYFTETGTYEPKNKDMFGWDGLIYLALTLDTSFEGKNIDVVVKGFRNNQNGEDIVLFEKTQPLDVVGVPRITTTWNTTNSSSVDNTMHTLATVNIGGSLPINLVYTNANAVNWEVEDNIGEVVYENGTPVFKLNKNLNAHSINEVRKITATASNYIDGIKYETSSTIEVKIVPFLVENIYFKDSSADADKQDKSANKSLGIHFNHTKDLSIGINAIYDVYDLDDYYVDLKADAKGIVYFTLYNVQSHTHTGDCECQRLDEYVEEFISNYENEITLRYHNGASPYMFTNEISGSASGNGNATTLSGAFLKEGNHSIRGYEISGYEKTYGINSTTGHQFTITTAESRVLDNFLSQVGFDYNTNAGKPIQIWAPNVDDYNYSNLHTIMTSMISVNVIPLSGDDNPMPIKSVDDLRNMAAGVSYILVNDLVLTNWTPVDGTFKTFDGNGYTITIASFGDVKGLTNIGLFSFIGDDNVDSYVSTVKNLTIDICPLTIDNDNNIQVSETGIVTVDIGTTEGVNFGILAGTNNGIVTNVNIKNNASDVRNERKATLKDLSSNEGEDDLLYNEKYHAVIIDQEVYDTYFSSEMTYENGLDGNSKKVNVDLYHMVDTVSVLTTNSQISLGLRVGGLVGVNAPGGYITNSSIQNINVKGSDYVAGFAGINNGYISSSFFKGGSVISNEKDTKQQAITAGFVAQNLSGKIQYCYVLGAETKDVYEIEKQTISYNRVVGGNINKDTADEVTTTYISSASDMLYINANSTTDRLEINLSNYAGYKLYEEQRNANELKNITQFRALGSAIYTNNYASGFVGENTAYISNSYSNIVVYGTYTSGFANNNAEGTIEHSYSMSSIENSDNTQYPFARTSGIINDSFYLLMAGSDNLPAKDGVDDYYYDKFSNASKQIANYISAGAFQDYNTFTAWAFNSDYSDNVNIVDGVWFIPQVNKSIATQNTFNEYFKEDGYTPLRPELVSANLRTTSLKFFLNTSTGDSDMNNMDTLKINWEYIDVEKWIRNVTVLKEVVDENDNKTIKSEEGTRYINIVQGAVSNPLLISTAEEFNINCGEPLDNIQKNQQANADDNNSRSDAVRMVHDINFNNIDQTAITYNVDYIGNFEGNGLSINNLRISADNEETEAPKDKVTRLGLFRRITRYTPQGSTVPIIGNVRNLNINIVEINGSNVNMVGVLAGAIDGGRVYNIVINDAEDNVVVEGLNAVGGLAGYISGDAEIVNVTSNVSVKANAINQYNTFSHKNPNKPNNQFKMFVSDPNITTNVEAHNIDSTLSTIIQNTSYVGGIAGIIDVNENATINAALSNINNIDRIRQCNVQEEVKLSAEVVGGLAGFVGTSTHMSSCSFIVNDKTQINATRIAGGVVGQNQGFLSRIGIEYATQKTIDAQFIPKSDNTKNDPNLYNKYDNPTNNDTANVLDIKQDTFINNAHYLGGVVGANIGGIIQNTYSRVNVVNISSQYAGGIVGLNLPAPTTDEYQFDQVYTTGSVYSFYAYGGIIGYQPYVKQITDAHGKHTYRIVDQLSMAGKGIDSYANNITELIQSVYCKAEVDANGNPVLAVDTKNVFITSDDYKNDISTTVLGIKTNYSNVVGANIWRRIDLNINRSQYYGGHNPAKLGTFVGYMSLSYQYTSIVKDDLLIAQNAVNERMIYEDTFFKQTYQYSAPNQIVTEIGNISGLDLTYSKDIGEKISNYIEYPSKSTSTKSTESKYFISGDYTHDGIIYRFSRLSYYGSLRTLNEFVHRTYLVGDNRNNANSIYNRLNMSEEKALANDTKISNVYFGWNSYNWNGVRLGENNTIYNDIQGVRDLFPSLVNNIQPSIIYVYTEKDLMLMHDYRNAKFVLKNDIQLTQNWVPVGSFAKPFAGELCSDLNAEGDYNRWTISRLNIAEDDNDYFGFVAVASKANFHDFKISYSKINNNYTSTNEDSSIAGAVLLGYAKNGENKSSAIYNVNIIAYDADANINIHATRYVGGFVGLAENVAIYNCSFTGFVPEAKGVAVVEEKPNGEFNSTMYLDKNKDLSYHFGILAGYVSVKNNGMTVTPSNSILNLSINIENYGKVITDRDFSEMLGHLQEKTAVTNNTEVNIGGMYGTIHGTSENTILDKNNIKDVVLNVNFKNNTQVFEKEGGVGSYKWLNTYNVTSIGTSDHFNIGGIVGYTHDTLFDSVFLDNYDINYSNENILAGAINIGGILGKGSDITTQDITKKDSDMTINNSCLKISTQDRIGGVFGYINSGSNKSDGQFDENNRIYITSSAINVNNMKHVVFEEQSGSLKLSSSPEGRVYIGGFAGLGETNAFSHIYIDNAKIDGDKTEKTSIIEYMTAPKQDLSVGGIYGFLNSGDIRYSYALGNINSNKNRNATNPDNEQLRHIGGLFGQVVNETTLDNLASDVDIIDSQYCAPYLSVYAGGIVGYTSCEEEYGINITNSHSTGKIYIENIVRYSNNSGWIGGIAGYVILTNIENVYSATQIVLGDTLEAEYRNAFFENDYNKGGIVGGFDKSISADNIYYVQDFVPFGNITGTGVEYDELMIANPIGFDLKDGETEIFKAENDTYPRLSWLVDKTIKLGENDKALSIYMEGFNTVPLVVREDQAGIVSYKDKTVYYITNEGDSDGVFINYDEDNEKYAYLTLQNIMTTLVVDGKLTIEERIYDYTSYGGRLDNNGGTIIGNNSSFVYDGPDNILGKNAIIFAKANHGLKNYGNIFNINSQNTIYNAIGEKNNIINKTYGGYIYASNVVLEDAKLTIDQVYNTLVRTGTDYTVGDNVKNIVVIKNNEYEYYFENALTGKWIFKTNFVYLTSKEAGFVDKFMNSSNLANVDKYWTMIDSKNDNRMVHQWMYKDKYYDTLLDNTYRHYDIFTTNSEDSSSIIEIDIKTDEEGSALDKLVKFVTALNNGIYTAEDVTFNITLKEDIDLSGKLWIPIGTEDNPFRGTFDGNGHIITGLRAMGNTYNGLFGVVQNATIQNLLVKGGQVAGYEKDSKTGILVGLALGNITLEKVGVEDAHIAGPVISGIVGRIKGTQYTPSEVKLTKTYAVIAQGDGDIKDFRTLVGSNLEGNTTFTIDQIYSAQIMAIVGNSEYEINETNKYVLTDLIDEGDETNHSYKASYSLTNFKFESAGKIYMLSPKSYHAMKTELLGGFDWSTTWTREYTENYGLPRLKFEEEYWIDEGKAIADLPSGEKYTTTYLGEEIEISPFDINATEFEIDYPHQLAWVAYMVNEEEYNFSNKQLKLNDQLDFSGKMWSPIGTLKNPFNGTVSIVSGDTLTIENLTTYGNYATADPSEDNKLLTREVDSTYGGLFGHFIGMFDIAKVDMSNIVVHNTQFAGALAGHLVVNEKSYTSLPTTSLTDIDIKGTQFVGGLVGFLNNELEDYFNVECVVVTENKEKNELSVDKTIEKSDNESYSLYVGGVVGWGSNIKIKNSSVLDTLINATGTNNSVQGGRFSTIKAGGISGHVNLSVVFNCETKNSTITSDDMAGGIVGGITTSELYACTTTNCDINGNQYAGGIAAYSSYCTVQNVTVTNGTISGKSTTGGILAYMNGYYLSEAVVKGMQLGTITGDEDNIGYYGGIVGYHVGGYIINVYSNVTKRANIKHANFEDGYLIGYTNSASSIRMAVLQCDHSKCNKGCMNLGLIGNDVRTNYEYNIGNLDWTITTSCRIHLLKDGEGYHIDDSECFEAFLYSSAWEIGNGTLSLKEAAGSTLKSKYHLYENTQYKDDKDNDKIVWNGTEILPYTYELKTMHDVYVAQQLNFISNYVRYRYGYLSNITINIKDNFDFDISEYQPIGINNYYPFMGQVLGNEKTIKFTKLVKVQHVLANKSIFNDNLGLIGYSEHLTISKLTMTTEEAGKGFTTNDGSSHVGAFVGKLAVNKNLTNTITECKAYINIEGDYSVGGIAGSISTTNDKAEINITKCIYSSIMVSPNDVNDYTHSILSTVGRKTPEGEEQSRIGGIVGQTSGMPAKYITVSNCKFQGQANGWNNIGGIVGFASCTSIESDEVRGTVEGKNTDPYYYNILYFDSSKDGDSQPLKFANAGGVVGYATNSTIKYCNTYHLSIGKGANAVGEAVGGIVGHANSTLIYNSDTNDAGAKTRISGYKFVGGIVGYINGQSLVDYCITNSKQSFALDDGASYIGGIVGCMDSQDNDSAYDITKLETPGTNSKFEDVEDMVDIYLCENNIDMVYQSEKTGNTTGINGYYGGILGGSHGNVSIIKCDNDGKVSVNDYILNEEIKGVGGILGAIASGNIFIDYCTNDGEIGEEEQEIAGGIVGNITTTTSINNPIKISNSTNTGGIVSIGKAGGIVGNIVSTISTNDIEISDCTNEGDLSTFGTHTNIRYVGGIVGYWKSPHRGGNQIINVESYGQLGNEDETIEYVGGIIGYAEKVNILGAESRNIIYATLYSQYIGGIAGYCLGCYVQDDDITTKFYGDIHVGSAEGQAYELDHDYYCAGFIGYADDGDASITADDMNIKDLSECVDSTARIYVYAFKYMWSPVMVKDLWDTISASKSNNDNADTTLTFTIGRDGKDTILDGRNHVKKASNANGNGFYECDDVYDVAKEHGIKFIIGNKDEGNEIKDGPNIYYTDYFITGTISVTNAKTEWNGVALVIGNTCKASLNYTYSIQKSSIEKHINPRRLWHDIDGTTDYGTTVTLHGTPITITNGANYTTGYSWDSQATHASNARDGLIEKLKQVQISHEYND